MHFYITLTNVIQHLFTPIHITENREASLSQLCRHWSTLQVAITTIRGTTNDDKVSITTTLGFR